jgi:hypothetical protein
MALAKDFEVSMALTMELPRAKTASLFAAGLMVCASAFFAAPARADESLWGKAMSTIGLGAKEQPESMANAANPAPVDAASRAAGSPQKALTPVAPPPPPPPPVRAAEPSMWDKMLGSVGVGGGNALDTINYNERSKLAVPKQRQLPPPPTAPGEPPPTRAANSDYLVKPPADYLEKARGADGAVSGLRDSDEPKDKKFFGLF